MKVFLCKYRLPCCPNFMCQSSVRSLPRRFGALEKHVTPLGFSEVERNLCQWLINKVLVCCSSARMGKKVTKLSDSGAIKHDNQRLDSEAHHWSLSWCESDAH